MDEDDFDDYAEMMEQAKTVLLVTLRMMDEEVALEMACYCDRMLVALESQGFTRDEAVTILANMQPGGSTK